MTSSPYVDEAAFLTLDRDLNEHLKALGVDVALGRDGAEQQVRDWLRQHE